MLARVFHPPPVALPTTPFVRCYRGRLPFAKQRKRDRRQPIQGDKWSEVNDPKLMVKNLRYAASRSESAGDAARITEFDAAAAAFPNPVPLVAATVLERANVITRDLDEWEADFKLFQQARRDEVNRPYLQEFIDRTLAQSKIKEASEKDVIEAGSAGGLDGFYANEGFADENEESMDETDFRPAARVTEADKINDLRSLDRALTQRLALFVRNKEDNRWWFPQEVRSEGERMVDAAHRGLLAAYGPVEAWYPGNGPIGFWLDRYSEEKQERTGCYGAKVFFYRAQIFHGRIALGDEYDDYRWLSRDEMYVSDIMKDRKERYYLHAIIGAGPGEEYWRSQRAKERRLTAGDSGADAGAGASAGEESAPASA